MSNDVNVNHDETFFARLPHIALFVIWIALTCVLDGLARIPDHWFGAHSGAWLFWYFLAIPIVLMIAAAQWLLRLRTRQNVKPRVAPSLVATTLLLESVILPFLNPYVAFPLLFMIGCYMHPHGCL